MGRSQKPCIKKQNKKKHDPAYYFLPKMFYLEHFDDNL